MPTGNGVYLPFSKYEDMENELARLRDAETNLLAEIEEKTNLYNDLDRLYTPIEFFL
jgi:hypothetical protein